MNQGTVRRGRQDAQSGAKVGAQCHLETARVGDALYLTLIGELDLSCVKRFGEAFNQAVAATPEDVVIDLRSVTFVDSTGLALLLKVDNFAREAGFRLYVVKSPIEIVQAVFEATGIDKILPMVDEPPGLPATQGPLAH
jgi:anti-sigma B factor antagonist